MFLIVALEFSNFLTYFRTALSPFLFMSSIIDFTVEETEEEVWRDDFKLDKINQTSDWGKEELDASQLSYAASDVLYLHKIKEKLDKVLKREKREDLAEFCFNFLKTRSKLDLIGFNDLDIFSH